ncbi:putative PIG3 family NAD(P)H quinone oxidoreductase [Isoptericola jiangsuensis]|uniref:Putative PIG3 family NAD(P)H quinone oxidoreductase n=1 Tax=Isoptericola jiangsuensis TaxID=548579 RepID=A0A2A9F295_9MICO|nr:NAD(P)H-quinone oxidoreductase [Isoptericola jiangsuensis]PFG44640.1 putative PIG3 family NAD(P)H quinone oxidoreductase [Isoptericola jiangsuensis]
MRAVTITVQGGSGKLTTSVTNLPDPDTGEIVVDVAASGVNRADLLQRAGAYPPPPDAPEWPGLEVSGIVRALGPGVSSRRVGDRVVALLGGGGYADRVVVPAAQTLPVPAGVDLVDAAGLPEAVCTAWTNLVDTGRLTRGETLLVHGGSGGVGSVAVQLGVALGARVVTTAGGPERVARCRELGADVVVDHRRDDVVAAVRDATDGRGADVVLDVLGGGALPDNVRVLAPGGRLVVIGLQQGRRGELDLAALMAKRATVTGTTLRSRSPREKAAIVAAVGEHVWPMVADGRLRPVVHERVPLADAERALAMLEGGEAFGKVLLVP